MITANPRVRYPRLIERGRRSHVGRIRTVDKQHTGHDLPSFRPPEGKPYMLLV